MTPALLALIFNIALQEKVDAYTLAGICMAESGGDIHAINRDDGGEDSLGLCQVKLSTARWLGFEGRLESLWHAPATNVRFAARYLHFQMGRYRNRRMAIAAYNSGTYRASSRSHRYIRRVEAIAAQMRGEE